MHSNPSVTVVINAHREGLLCWASLQSVSRAKAQAELHGIDVEILVALDRVDSLTRNIVDEWTESGVCKIVFDNGDLGRSRNDAVQRASNEWIAFLDADDIWGETWLYEAVSASLNDNRTNVVWHPEVNIYFGYACHLYRHIDMEEQEFKLTSLVGNNYWTSLCFARRDLLRKVPYPATQLQQQIGFEDWGWNRAVIDAGAIHKVVRGTGHAIRTREGSLVKLTTAKGSIPSPTYLFRNELWKRTQRSR
jgi:glycosyltransferase involved in cell wall biosynthesis